MTLDASGRLGIGTTSPGQLVTIAGSSNPAFQTNNTSGVSVNLYAASSNGVIGTGSNHAFAFHTNDTERARITSGGDLLVGKTTTDFGTNGVAFIAGAAMESVGSNNRIALKRTTDGNVIEFYQTVNVGSISITSTATAYNTSSDYRLKDNPQPLTGSGVFIDALKPKTWSWKADGSKGVGFIAHEVQEVSPGSVTGEKDGEQMQAMEYGSAEFIANIIAELQSLRARVAQLEAK
jgi:hypothetical protein